MADDRRAILEAIAYGSDARISPGDRLRAIEQLAEVEQFEARSVTLDRLTPEQARQELESLRTMCDGALAIMDGPEAIEPPTDAAELRETLDLALEVNAALEARLADRERALQRLTVHRRLLSAAEPVG